MESTEKHRRSGVKAISYRVLSISVDSFVAYFFTRDAVLSAGIVLLVNGYSTLLYYLHERIWAHSTWGLLMPKRIVGNVETKEAE